MARVWGEVMGLETATIKVPEGFSLHWGDQPRHPEIGDWYLDIDGEAHICMLKSSRKQKFLVLRKVAPAYRTRTFGGGGATVGVPETKYVEVQAVKDALGVIKMLIKYHEIKLEDEVTSSKLDALFTAVRENER